MLADGLDFGVPPTATIRFFGIFQGKCPMAKFVKFSTEGEPESTALVSTTDGVAQFNGQICRQDAT